LRLRRSQLLPITFAHLFLWRLVIEMAIRIAILCFDGRNRS
jgi:hypothetical protein